uniref:winged helix-turn-helix domain-containing protein n=1 Tax=Ameyamaea chiangmaiensis TaxID=442969 RepID=UPI001FEA644B|nr:LysR family transcriptional regulator [Ameyamaea chiangmaiensis]
MDDPAAALRLTLRLDAHGRALLGHGKIRLLEHVRDTGSISAAARAMGMSYRRAWLLVEATNAAFATPLVLAKAGGGGGATLSEAGRAVVAAYRALEKQADACARDAFATIGALLSPSK